MFLYSKWLNTLDIILYRSSFMKVPVCVTGAGWAGKEVDSLLSSCPIFILAWEYPWICTKSSFVSDLWDEI